MEHPANGPLQRLLDRPHILDPRDVLKDYLEVASQAYWEEKDLALVATLSIAGISYGYGIERDCGETNPELVHELLSTVKAIAYNLASFTWPGWNEAGIRIGVTDVDLGLDAAKLNLQLAQHLQKGDLAISRAYWMLGGHYLAARLYAEAGHCYGEAMTLASRAGETAEQDLALGFAVLTTMCVDPHDERAEARLLGVIESLKSLDNGAGFIEQIETAREVFVGS